MQSNCESTLVTTTLSKGDTRRKPSNSDDLFVERADSSLREAHNVHDQTSRRAANTKDDPQETQRVKVVNTVKEVKPGTNTARPSWSLRPSSSVPDLTNQTSKAQGARVRPVTPLGQAFCRAPSGHKFEPPTSKLEVGKENMVSAAKKTAQRPDPKKAAESTPGLPVKSDDFPRPDWAPRVTLSETSAASNVWSSGNPRIPQQISLLPASGRGTSAAKQTKFKPLPEGVHIVCDHFLQEQRERPASVHKKQKVCKGCENRLLVRYALWCDRGRCWRTPRQVPPHVRAAFRLCKHFESGTKCGKEPCTFAHGWAEQMYWTMERKQGTVRLLIVVCVCLTFPGTLERLRATILDVWRELPALTRIKIGGKTSETLCKISVYSR